MTVFFNNCQIINGQVRNHATIYHSRSSTIGEVPFYDRVSSAKMFSSPYIDNLDRGDECVVGRYKDHRKTHVMFDHYEFVRTEIQRPDDDDEDSVVFFGCLKHTEPPMRKAAAAKHTLYTKFFNRNGGFKRLLVLMARK